MIESQDVKICSHADSLILSVMVVGWQVAQLNEKLQASEACIVTLTMKLSAHEAAAKEQSDAYEALRLKLVSAHLIAIATAATTTTTTTPIQPSHCNGHCTLQQQPLLQPSLIPAVITAAHHHQPLMQPPLQSHFSHHCIPSVLPGSEATAAR